jgi:ABC-type methionine transport system ATPase subunit
MILRARLVFPERRVREPVIARLVRSFDVEPSIRRASIDDHSGWMLLELSGEPSAVEGALAWLAEQGVEVEPLGDVVES